MKTVLVAVYHPVMTNSKIGFFQKIIGYGTQTPRNPQLDELMGTLATLAQQYNDVIFLSGKDQNIQFVQDDGIEQIIAGTTENPKKKQSLLNGTEILPILTLDLRKCQSLKMVVLK